MKGVSCSLKESSHYLWQFLLAPPTVGLPEAGDMYCVNCASLSFSTCHIFFVARKKMQACMMETYWALKHTMKLFTSHHEEDETVAGQFKAFLLLSLPPALSKFSVVGKMPCIDVYAFFRFEQMHVCFSALAIWLNPAPSICWRTRQESFVHWWWQAGTWIFSLIKIQYWPCWMGMLRKLQRIQLVCALG